MRTLRTLVLLGLVALAAGAAVVFGGFADVAATTPHWAATRFVLENAMEHAVERAARGLEAPPLDAESRVRSGAAAYDEMCAVCHGIPGSEPSVIARGLNPEPPELAEEEDEDEEEEGEEWSPEELFWVVKHGVRMTGMPGFGPTHDDAELWDIVAFLQRLPELDPAEYRALARGAPAHHHDAHEHGH